MNFSNQDYHFMQQALTLAAEAGQAQEVPVGAVLVHEDRVIGTGANAPIHLCDPTAHAEILALRAASVLQANYRLINTTLYVTLEPCLMCVGAIVHARIARVVYAAKDSKAGAVESVIAGFALKHLNHRVSHCGGILADEASHLLKQFFKSRRF